MINISDIRDRLLVNPEPAEVKNIRNLILSSFKDLEFFEEPHKYFLHNPDGSQTELPSVSGVIHQFEPPKDWDTIRIKKAKREGIDPDVLKRQWRENNLRSTSNGSKTHLFLENMMKLWIYGESALDQEISHYQYEDGFLIPYGTKEAAGIKFWKECVLDKPDVYPIMPEAKIYTGLAPGYSFKQEYCGTFDLLFAKKDQVSGKYMPFLADYKGLPLDTPILTVSGWKTMGTLSEQDSVYDKNGNPTKILHLSEVHYNPCYEIRFNNGDTIVADHEHRWEVSFRKGSVNKTKIMTTIEIKDYLENLNKKPSRYGHLIPKILNPKPIQGPEKELPIDPYVLGVWLGDGSKQCGSVTNMYDDIFNEIEKAGYKVGPDISNGGSGKAKTRTIYGLSKELKKLGIINNKYIPEEYFTSSYNQRLRLLQGIMDTDGYYHKKRNRYILSFSYPRLKSDFEKLICTLGIKITTFKVKKGYKQKDGTKKYFNGYDICFCSDENLFLSRKVSVQSKQNKSFTFRNIEEVRKVPMVPTRCIEVDSDTHTYLATEKLIVTHNTNKDLTNDFARKRHQMMLPPFQDMVDEPLSHYTLQLSCYQMGIEQLGIPVSHRIIVWLKEDGTYELIPVPDVTDRLKLIL